MVDATRWREQWTRRARALRRRVNAGWWWHVQLRILLPVCGGVAVGLLWARYRDWPTSFLWVLLAGLVALGAFFSLLLSRRHFIDIEEAFCRLDVGCHLHQRLVSARQGVGDWPCPTEPSTLPLAWRGVTVWFPILLCACFLAMGALLPLPERVIPPVSQALPPPEWTALETLAMELRERELVAESALEKMEQALAELRAKAPETWYRPATLEATAELLSQVRADAVALLEALRQTGALLESAAAHPESLSPDAQAERIAVWEQLRRQMGEGAFPLDAQRLQELGRIDPAQLGEWDPVMLDEMLAQVGSMGDQLSDLLAAAGLLEGEEHGAGVVSRGGGASQLTFSEKSTALTAAQPLPVTNLDPTRAVLGDLLSVQQGEHEEPAAAAVGPAGTVTSPGGVGAVVWRFEVLPSEEAILRAYFK